MSTKLKGVIELTSKLTGEKVVEAIRKARFGEKMRKAALLHYGSIRVVRKECAIDRTCKDTTAKTAENGLMTSWAQYSAEEK